MWSVPEELPYCPPFGKLLTPMEKPTRYWNCKQNGKEEDLEVSGVVSLLLSIKKRKEQGGGEDLELSGGIALLLFNKDM
jgi:hypothetical protein